MPRDHRRPKTFQLEVKVVTNEPRKRHEEKQENQSSCQRAQPGRRAGVRKHGLLAETQSGSG